MSPDRGEPLPFKADIEGLRAVAILLVVAAHIGVGAVSGGFIGVDVFFVLSGYLITGLLIHELQNTGRIALARFYARRFRRLLPSLLVVLFFSCWLGSLLIATADLPRQALSAAMASVWLSNFHFALTDTHYFGPEASSNLFLHTWSLGVEEQFYLLWPLLLLLAAGRQQSRNDRALRLKWSFAVVFGLSLAACIWLSNRHQPLAFYMMPMRAWQFALGGLVFLFATTLARRRVLCDLVGLAGLGLILTSAIALTSATIYPGLWALLPAIGTAFVLAAGSASNQSAATFLLSLTPLPQIGRLSYCWYLWHWPVLLLGQEVLPAPSITTRFALAALSLMLASMTHAWVEKPLRQHASLVSRPGMAVFVAFVLMIVGHLSALVLHNRALLQAQSPEQLRYFSVRGDISDIYAMGCDDWYHSAEVKLCAFGDPAAPNTAVIVGDSVGLQWFPAVSAVLNKPGWRLLAVTKSSCPMVAAPIYYTRIGREYTECAQWREDALRQIAELHPKVVILGSSYNYDLDRTAWVDGTTQVLASLSQSADKVYLLRSTPVMPFDAPSCLAPRSALFQWLAPSDRCTASAHDPKSEAVFGWIRSAALKFANVETVDLTNAICPNGLCRAELDGVLVFRDGQHLTARFAASLSPVLAMHLAPTP